MLTLILLTMLTIIMPKKLVHETHIRVKHGTKNDLARMKFEYERKIGYAITFDTWIRVIMEFWTGERKKR